MWTGVVVGLLVGSPSHDVTLTENGPVGRSVWEVLGGSSFFAWAIGAGVVFGVVGFWAWKPEFVRRALHERPAKHRPSSGS